MIIYTNGMVTRHISVEIKIYFDASMSSPPYSFAKSAQKLAVGIAAPTTIVFRNMVSLIKIRPTK